MKNQLRRSLGRLAAVSDTRRLNGSRFAFRKRAAVVARTAVATLAVCFSLICSVGSADAAGCRYASHTRFAASLATNYQEGGTSTLENAFAGRWQYEAGNTHFLFHPVPESCQGPNCRSLPESAAHIGTVLQNPVRLQVADERLSFELHNTTWSPAWNDLESSSTGATLYDELLRPPSR